MITDTCIPATQMSNSISLKLIYQALLHMMMSRLSATDPGWQKKIRSTAEMSDAWRDAAITDYFAVCYVKNVFIALWKMVAADQSETIMPIISRPCFYYLY